MNHIKGPYARIWKLQHAFLQERYAFGVLTCLFRSFVYHQKPVGACRTFLVCWIGPQATAFVSCHTIAALIHSRQRRGAGRVSSLRQFPSHRRSRIHWCPAWKLYYSQVLIDVDKGRLHFVSIISERRSLTNDKLVTTKSSSSFNRFDCSHGMRCELHTHDYPGNYHL